MCHILLDGDIWLAGAVLAGISFLGGLVGCLTTKVVGAVWRMVR